MLLSALIALSGGQIPPISKIATPPDNKIALYCIWDTRAQQQVCYTSYCAAYPNDCTSAFAPTRLLPKLDRTQLADRSCILITDGHSGHYRCFDIGDGSSSAALPQVERTFAFK